MTDLSPRAVAPAAPRRKADRKSVDWGGELRSLLWLLGAIWLFWSFVAKPFYIPSESMMPTLWKGDRLVVSKYPYGWSFASLTFHPIGFVPGRVLGRLPERGDVVIVVPPGRRDDYIKRVIGLPGDRLMVRDGVVWLNGRAVPRERMPDEMVPLDANTRALAFRDSGGTDARFAGRMVTDATGKRFFRLPVYRETLPNGRRYDTIDADPHGDADNYGPVTIPAGRVFLMGDNRDDSADSRIPIEGDGLGGAVPAENIGGRAEFITFSLDGSSDWLRPLSWFTALRGGGRAGTSLRPDQAPAAP